MAAGCNRCDLTLATEVGRASGKSLTRRRRRPSAAKTSMTFLLDFARPPKRAGTFAWLLADADMPSCEMLEGPSSSS